MRNELHRKRSWQPSRHEKIMIAVIVLMTVIVCLGVGLLIGLLTQGLFALLGWPFDWITSFIFWICALFLAALIMSATDKTE